MTWNTAPARAYRTIVTVNGVERPHDPTGITWAQDITSDLPSTVTAGGQVATRTGTIVWQTEGSSTRPDSPWYSGASWIPTVGEPVTVDVTDGTNTHRVFTGVIDTIDGDATGARSSKVVSAVRGSNRVIRRQALTATGGLPAAGEVGKFGTTSVWVISEICRELGYESTPPAPAKSRLILDAPLQGSTYNYSLAPYANAQVVTSHRAGYPTLHPVWNSGRDGFGIADSVVEWTPNTGLGPGSGSVGVSILVYSAHASDALVRVYHGANADTYLRVTGAKTVRVSTYRDGATVSHDVPTPIPAGDGPHWVSANFRGGEIHVWVGGVEHTFTAPTPAEAVTRIRLDAGASSCVAGLQVNHPSVLKDHHGLGWKPTAFYRYGTGTNTTVLAPSIRDEKAGDVLSSYADALLSPLWVDGHGDLQVVTGKALHGSAPSLEVDALADVSDLSYTMELLDHRPTVEVTYAHAHQVNAGATAYKTKVWQGSGITVDPDTPDQTFVEVPDDEEWIGLADPASASQFLWPNGTPAAFYTGNGSWWGFALEDTAGNEFMTANVSQVVETLNPWVWKITSTTSEVDGAAAKTPSQYSTIPQRFRDYDLPIYRARSLVRYEDRTVAVKTPGATDFDGVLSHDAGRWVTTTSAATELAQWVHDMVSTPTPVLDGLRVRFDPRIEVGAKITVRAKSVFGADFEALVLSVDHDPGTDSTAVLARVTRVMTLSTNTFDAVDNAHIGQTLAYWDDARKGRTLNAVAADPYTT